MKYCLFASLLLLILSVPTIADEGSVPVSPDKLEGDSLKTPVGTLDLPKGFKPWVEYEGLYYAFPKDDSAGFISVYYQPLQSSGSLEDTKNSLRDEIMAKASPERRETFEIRPSQSPLFGTTFDYSYEEEEGRVAGTLATAQGHTLIIFSGASQAPEALLRRTVAGFHPNEKARRAKKLESRSLEERTSKPGRGKLQGKTLRSVGGTIEPPGEDWAWREMDLGGEPLYICSRSTTENIMFANIRGTGDLDKLAEGFVKGMSEKIGAGAKLEKKYSPSTLPFPGKSKRIDLKLKLDQEIVFTGVGVLGTDGKQSVLLIGLSDRSLEQEVMKMARSFKADLKPGLNPKSFNTGLAVFTLFFGLLVVSLTGLFNYISKRPRVNGAKFAVIVTFLFGALSFMAAFSRTGDGASTGHAVGSFLLPFTLFAWLSSRFDKKRKLWLNGNDNLAD